MKVRFEIDEDDVVLLLTCIKESTPWFFDNCSEQWVDDMWSEKNCMEKRLLKLKEKFK